MGIGYSRWNFIPTLFLRRVKSISGLAAAIVDLQRKTTSGDVACSTVESSQKHGYIAVGISFLAHPCVDTKVFPLSGRYRRFAAKTTSGGVVLN